MPQNQWFFLKKGKKKKGKTEQFCILRMPREKYQVSFTEAVLSETLPHNLQLHSLNGNFTQEV